MEARELMSGKIHPLPLYLPFVKIVVGVGAKPAVSPFKHMGLNITVGSIQLCTILPGIFCNWRCSSISVEDDLFISTHDSATSLSAIDEVLKAFYAHSGLKVNYSKSEIFCCGLSDSAIASLSGVYGFKVGILPVKYLGFPLVTGKLSEKELRPLMAKITDKMSSWTAKHPSFAGRVQLISSVIQGITNFWSSIFIHPKKVIREVEQKCNAFLWNNTTDTARGAKVKWESLCFPKQEGGLGIKGLELWNISCIMRYIWMIFSQAGSIWVAWVHEYLLKNCSFWTV
ncbi:hypothetical protein SLEP1_g8598 [Rubroshorea leprosula]|uniref:Reverse transcriptase domain-containing protein n=1 Tax=Rubroshorea leprosula TaxID=152421 RepID=A0AAV5IC08_9ROSI|nr:hypothetical protein SLEP1_g8598 [Rubroshorea leprosula]